MTELSDQAKIFRQKMKDGASEGYSAPTLADLFWEAKDRDIKEERNGDTSEK